MPKESKRPNQAALVGKARSDAMRVADRVARARAATPPRDPTGEHHETIADLARRCGRDVVDLLDEWDERAAIRQYEGAASREEAEQMAAVDLEATYSPIGMLS